MAGLASEFVGADAGVFVEKCYGGTHHESLSRVGNDTLYLGTIVLGPSRVSSQKRERQGEGEQKISPSCLHKPFLLSRVETNRCPEGTPELNLAAHPYAAWEGVYY